MKIFTKILVFVLAVEFMLGLANLTRAAGTTVSLGAAASFAVLGGTTVANTGSTVLNGDLGTSPGSSITGFPPGTYTGSLHSADATALNAKNDATDAFTDLGLQACDSDLSGQNLGGMTLVPGVYCFSSSAQLTGILNLNAQNDPNAVWIFKMGSTLTTASGSSVVFSNGGSGPGCNVFWRVGSSATLGTTTAFVGTIVADHDITLTTGATVNGRVLALGASADGAITLATNTITPVVCASTPTPTPIETPTPTASSTAFSTSISLSSSGVESIFCPALNIQIISPIILESRRVDADSIFLSWGPYSGINTFDVQYGIENGKWLYSTDVVGFSTTINNLPINVPIWVRVGARSDCTMGIYGQSKLVRGPVLPGTGFAPRDNNIIMIIWNMTSQDLLNYSVSSGFLILVGFVSYAFYNLSQTLKESTSILTKVDDITKDVESLKDIIKNGILYLVSIFKKKEVIKK